MGERFHVVLLPVMCVQQNLSYYPQGKLNLEATHFEKVSSLYMCAALALRNF